MSLKVKELKEKQARVWEQQKEITDAAFKDGKRNLTTEEEKKWNDLDSDFESMARQIEIQEKTAARDAKMSTPLEVSKGGGSISMREALQEMVKKNGRGLSDEVREVLYAGMPKELRAQTTQTDSSGGYLIPTSLANEIIKSLQEYGGIRGIAKVITTTSGNDLQYPTAAVQGGAAWIGENTQVSPNNAAFGQKTIAAFKATSGVFLIPTELLEDSQFDIAAFIRDAAAESMGRLENAAFVDGDGSSKPTGFVRQATVAQNTASKTAITTDELIDLMHSVNPAYRKQGCHFVFNDTTLKMIRKLKDDNELYIWQMGDISKNVPATLLGNPYIVEQDMPSFGAGLKPIAFGNFQRFLIRDVAGMRMLNLVERYADYDQLGIIAFHRTDCELLDTAAVKVLRNPTT